MMYAFQNIKYICMSEFSDICLVPNKKPDYDHSDLFWPHKNDPIYNLWSYNEYISILLIFSWNVYSYVWVLMTHEYI